MANLARLTKEYGTILWTGKKCVCGLPISFTRYILTETKLITRAGFLNLREDEIELYRVFDKSLSLPLGQRMTGCGTIKLLAKDVDTPIKELVSVKQPRVVKHILDEAIQNQREKYYVNGREMIGAMNPTGCYHEPHERHEDFAENERA